MLHSAQIRTLSAAVLLAGVVASSTPAKAATDVLYYVDALAGTDRMASALAGLGGAYTATTVATPTAFNTALATGNYEIAVFLVQGNVSSGYASSLSALGSYISGGGRAIYCDWSINDTYGAIFNADFTGVINQTSMTVSSPLLTPGVSSPVTFINPGWGTYTTQFQLVPLSGGSVVGTFTTGGGAIIRGNGGRTYINGFLSDTFANGADGVNLFQNEIRSLVPEPTTLAAGLAGLGVIARRVRRAAR